MLTTTKLDDKKALRSVKCAICQEDAKNNARIQKLGTNFGIICNDCHEELSRDEIQLISNMFTAFGGYFGKLKTKKHSNYEIIKELAEEFKVNKGKIELSKINIQLLHKALLYGITPRRFIKGLELVLFD
jgi:hypothetical protein